jgi:hypothetical protein
LSIRFILYVRDYDIAYEIKKIENGRILGIFASIDDVSDPKFVNKTSIRAIYIYKFKFII